MSRLVRLTRTAASGLLLLAPLLLASRPVGAQEPTAPAATLSTRLPATDPQALALFTQMIRTYQGLKSYAATETATSPSNMWMSYQMKLTYARPDRAGAEVTRVQDGEKATTLRIVSDGTNYFASNSQQPKRYLKTTPTPGKPVLNEVLSAANIQEHFPAIFLEYGEMMLKALTDPESKAGLSMGKPDVVDGVAVDTIILQRSDANYQSTTSMQIGRADHLLRRVQNTEGNQGQPQRSTTQTFTDVQTNFAAPASLFAFTPPEGAQAAAPATNAKSDPKAVALMSQMYAAYKALSSYSGVTQASSVMPARDAHGKALTISSEGTASYQFQQPNKIAFSRTGRQGTARAVSDGQTLYAISDENKGGPEEWRERPRYLKRAAPATDIPWNDKMTLAQFGGLPMYGTIGNLRLMPEVVLGLEILPADGAYGFQVGAPSVINGEPVDVVFYEQQSSYLGGIPSDDKMISTFWIGQRDHLLRQASEEWVRADGTQKTVETYTDIKVNPVLPPSTFEFTPPANAIAVDTVAGLIPPSPVVGPKLHVGDAAPAAAFGATDINGQPVKAGEYAGKVLLLDFWGTWCGPCIRQMPSLVAAYRKYHDQGFEVIGYALEQSKNKDKLPAFTAKHNMEWRQVWDKDAVIANACGPMNGVPFVIIIGRDGRVAALGNPGEGGVDVDAEVQAALAN